MMTVRALNSIHFSVIPLYSYEAYFYPVSSISLLSLCYSHFVLLSHLFPFFLLFLLYTFTIHNYIPFFLPPHLPLIFSFFLHHNYYLSPIFFFQLLNISAYCLFYTTPTIHVPLGFSFFPLLPSFSSQTSHSCPTTLPSNSLSPPGGAAEQGGAVQVSRDVWVV